MNCGEVKMLRIQGSYWLLLWAIYLKIQIHLFGRSHEPHRVNLITLGIFLHRLGFSYLFSTSSTGHPDLNYNLWLTYRKSFRLVCVHIMFQPPWPFSIQCLFDWLSSEALPCVKPQNPSTIFERYHRENGDRIQPVFSDLLEASICVWTLRIGSSSDCRHQAIDVSNWQSLVELS